jgi:Ca-activated chloride channel family protein
MRGPGERELKEAMNLLLDKKKAEQYFINFSPSDKVIVIPFSDEIKDIWKANGNNPKEIKELNSKIQNLSPGGATDIYSPVIDALTELENIDTDEYTPAIILMTDGASNSGKSFTDLSSKFENAGVDIPVFSIMFGEASETQLKEISNLTKARIFDGRSDLIQAFRTTKGYN